MQNGEDVCSKYLEKYRPPPHLNAEGFFIFMNVDVTIEGSLQ